MAKVTNPLKVAIAADPRHQKEIAAEVGLSETNLSQIVNGWRPADESTRSALADTLGKSSDDLFAANGLALADMPSAEAA